MCDETIDRRKSRMKAGKNLLEDTVSGSRMPRAFLRDGYKAASYRTEGDVRLPPKFSSDASDMNMHTSSSTILFEERVYYSSACIETDWFLVGRLEFFARLFIMRIC